jgi:hypothetical protein
MEWTKEMEAEFEDWKKKLSPKELEKILWEVSY